MKEQEKLVLIAPTREWEQRLLDYRHEFNVSGDSIDGSAGLKTASSLEAWLAALDENSREETVRKGLVPASTYLGVRPRDNCLCGMVDIRHRLNDGLMVTGGHIGYSVRPSERNKGYATQLLTLALERCRELGIKRALLSCYKDNLPSARVIQKCGGVLENEIVQGGRKVQRYWIDISGE